MTLASSSCNIWYLGLKVNLKHFRAWARSGNNQIIGSSPNMLALGTMTLFDSGLKANVRSSFYVLGRHSLAVNTILALCTYVFTSCTGGLTLMLD